MKKKTKSDPWLYIYQKSDVEWIGEWIMANLAWEFYKKNKRFPTKLKKDSIVVKGRNLSVEME